MKAMLLVLVVLLALVAAFAVQNPGIIVFRFLTYSGYTSLLVVIVAAFAAGMVSAGLAGLPGFFRRRSEAAPRRDGSGSSRPRSEISRENPGGRRPPRPGERRERSFPLRQRAETAPLPAAVLPRDRARRHARP